MTTKILTLICCTIMLLSAASCKDCTDCAFMQVNGTIDHHECCSDDCRAAYESAGYICK